MLSNIEVIFKTLDNFLKDYEVSIVKSSSVNIVMLTNKKDKSARFSVSIRHIALSIRKIVPEIIDDENIDLYEIIEEWFNQKLGFEHFLVNLKIFRRYHKS